MAEIVEAATRGSRPMLVAAAVLGIALIFAVGAVLIWTNNHALVPPANTPAPSATTSAAPSATPSATPAPTPTASNLEPPGSAWPGAVRADAEAMPELTMSGSASCVAEGGFTWQDGRDAEAGMVDIVAINRSSRTDYGLRTDLTLGSKPPRASTLDPHEALIQYGLVFDANRDGAPDYELGIDNSVGGGSFRTWLTDLGLNQTKEQLGPPYGVPFEFSYPDESDAGASPIMSFSFLYGTRPSALARDYRYYAWSSYAENGAVVAWDYAPDFGWLGLPECQALPANGWPTMHHNEPGLYSWTAAPVQGGGNPNVGFMHNGYGSGDVTIEMRVVQGYVSTSDAAREVVVAGHDGTYRRIEPGRDTWTVDQYHALAKATDDLWEEWIFEVDGTTIAIHLMARSGTSEADLADAHHIIDSLTYEPVANRYGFRLVFALTTDDWDSG